MKKVFCLIGIISLLFVAACGRGKRTENDMASADPARKKALIEADGIPKTDMMVDYCYRDGVSSFRELLEKSAYIVQGTVISIKQNTPIAQMAVVNVSQVYCGKVPDTIYVCQMANDNPMKEGREYLLFMNLQDTDTEDTFYPVSGGTGIVRVAESSRQLMIANGIIDDEDLQSWVSEKTPYGSFGIGIGKEEGRVYLSGRLEVTFRHADPLEEPAEWDFEWMPLTEEMLNGVTDVLVGRITEIEEIAVCNEMFGNAIMDYWSLITVSVSEKIRNGDGIEQGDRISVLFELSSHRTEDRFLPESGKEYVFFLRKTAELNEAIDYAPAADYMYKILPLCLIPVDEPQNPDLLRIIGVDEDISAASFIETLRN